jgi:methionine sulfoxide reductase heme-binding subunit
VHTDPTPHLFWLASRALGIAALVLLGLAVALGLGLAGRIARAPGAPGRLKQLHEAVAVTAIGAIVAHGLVLLGDGYLRPSLEDIALPFAMAKQPAWTGVGIIGGWIALISGLSFYVRRWITTPVWRWLHRWIAAAYVLALAHTFGSGSDAAEPWLMTIAGLSAATVVFAATYRLLPGAKPPRRRPPDRGAAPDPGGRAKRPRPVAADPA